MKLIKPTSGQKFIINPTPEWPEIVFETDAKGDHTWNWSISWGKYRMAGRVITKENRWDARPAVTNYGGLLTVQVQAGKEPALTTRVKILGENPTIDEAKIYLALTLRKQGLENIVKGLDKIITHESKFKNFTVIKEPIKTFDHGYGLCQLTTPPPTYGQVWNWRLNIEAGIKLYLQKRAEAVAYLGKNGRAYTDEQLMYEIVNRYNGGVYHIWDSKAGKWERPSKILCDTQTGNIGWNMTDKENAGKTEAELHKRDSQSYKHPPGKDAHWRYYGVCYAEAILD